MKSTHNWLKPDHQHLYDCTEGPYGSPDPFECWLLMKLAEDARNVLEIGTWRGRSACFLARGVRPGQTLTCVDWFLGDDTGGAGASEELTRAALRANGLDAIIINADMLATDWQPIIDDVDLVFYDAIHRKEPAVQVLTAIHSFLNANARVVLHDAFFDEMRAAVDELKASGLYRAAATIDCWEGLEILQRNDVDPVDRLVATS